MKTLGDALMEPIAMNERLNWRMSNTATSIFVAR